MTAKRIAWFVAAFVVVMGALVLFPGIDLWASGLFYRAGDGFFLGDWGPVRALYRAVPLIVTAAVVVIVKCAPPLASKPVPSVVGVPIATSYPRRHA